MLKSELSDILNKIDSLYQLHISTRGILQYVGPDKIGLNEFNWGTQVNGDWIKLRYRFEKPVDESMRVQLNKLSEFMNQNFIVRLHSLLEYEKIKGKKIPIDKSLNGHEMIEIVHFLRKQYAHRHGDFDPSDKDSVMLRNRLYETFNINSNESLPTQFPLDKNRVIKPIVDGTKQYVIELFKKKNKNGS